MIASFSGPHRFLSNFYSSPIELDGVTFPTVEHAFQALKSTDPDRYAEIAAAPTPAAAKKMGRKVTLRPDWDRVKDTVMADLLALKFKDPALRAKLLATGDEVLVEGNTWHDQYWGDCTCWTHAGVMGANTLGRLLMMERQALAAAA